VATILYRLGEVREVVRLEAARFGTNWPQLNHGEEVRGGIHRERGPGCANRLGALRPCAGLTARSRRPPPKGMVTWRCSGTFSTRGSPDTRVCAWAHRVPRFEAPLDHLKATRIPRRGLPLDTATQVAGGTVSRANWICVTAEPQTADRRAEQLVRTLADLKFSRPRSNYNRIVAGCAAPHSRPTTPPRRELNTAAARGTKDCGKPIARGPGYEVQTSAMLCCSLRVG